MFGKRFVVGILLTVCLVVGADAHMLKSRSDVTPTELRIWDYTTDKIRGISLGGWFVLEPYITPSLFEQFGSNESQIPVDEYTFCEQLGEDEALVQLEKHWSEYYTEDDFRDIKNYGLNLVRIPIGYWAFLKRSDDPYVQGQEKYLDQSIQWAENYGLKVWLDLHGVPGSQNGFDNSGKRGRIGWQDDEQNLEITMKTLDYIFQKYGQSNLTDTVIGIEIVNEPMMPSLNLSDTLQFTYDSYYNFREKYSSENWFLVQEGFMPVGYWNVHLNNNYSNVSLPYVKNISSTYLKDNYFHGIVIDHHHYEVFTDVQLENSSEERVNDIIKYSKALNQEQQYHPSLVGEWSGAITDCAKWLNGVGTGARYDGTFSTDQLNRRSTLSPRDSPTCSNVRKYSDMSKQHRADIRRFIEIQLISYEMDTAGWIFWNYKTEDAIEWDFKKLVEKKLFPYPFDDYMYFLSDGTTTARYNSGSSLSISPWMITLSLGFTGLMFIAGQRQMVWLFI
jgi:glucan 1,3-beta-glucosidase